MNFFNNPSLLSFSLLLFVLAIFLGFVGYLLYKIYKKDKERVVPIQYTSAYKKADSKITNGILDLQTVGTHQDLRVILHNIEDGLVFFKNNELLYNGKTPDEIIQLLTKHTETKLLQIYETLEKDLVDISEEEKERLLQMQESDLAEYKRFKVEREEKRKEIQAKLELENEREKVINQLLKRDEEFFEQQRLERIYNEVIKKK